MGSYDGTFGALLVGTFFNTFLYGLVTYQFAAYFRMKFNDRPVTKYMVLFLFILDTLHSISAIYMVWYYVVTNYGNPASLGVAIWPYSFTPFCTALAALVTQIYLGHRIWLLTNSKILYGVVIALAIPSFILGLGVSIGAWVVKVISEMASTTPLVIAWLSMQVLVDAFITTTLVIVFSRWRGGFRRTDSVLNRLICGAIQTGLFSGIFSIGNLIFLVALPDMALYNMFGIPTGRIYSNTLLDALLTRESLSTEMNGPYSVGTSDLVCRALHDSSQRPPVVRSGNFQLQVKRTDLEQCDQSDENTDSKLAPAL